MLDQVLEDKSQHNFENDDVTTEDSDGPQSSVQNTDWHQYDAGAMDGSYSTEKVYGLMKNLRQEQSKSQELLRKLNAQTNKTMGLKMVVKLLCFFSVVLALSNVGTSLVAARLAKDTEVDPLGNDLVNINTHERIATTPKFTEVIIQPIESSSRRLRHLQEDLTDIVCRDISESSTLAVCEMQGEISLDDATKLYQEFCPQYPWPGNTPEQRKFCSGGASSVMLNCKGKVSNIMGGQMFPSDAPPTVLADESVSYTVFPGSGSTFNAQQRSTGKVAIRSSRRAMSAQTSCIQDFQFALYCEPDESACLIFVSYSRQTCDKEVYLCPEPTGSTTQN